MEATKPQAPAGYRECCTAMDENVHFRTCPLCGTSRTPGARNVPESYVAHFRATRPKGSA